jgi:prepilin peptidase CpaA
MSLPIWSTGACVALVGIASFTDLRWRRIPNYLTFPAVVFGLLSHSIDRGWEGLLLSISGTLLAPCVLSLLHLGRGPGMGDIKLAAALGSILGPPLGAVAMLASAIAGGILAALWILIGEIREGSLGILFGRHSRGGDEEVPGKLGAGTKGKTIPYGVALSVGTLVTLAAYWWTGAKLWFF